MKDTISPLISTYMSRHAKPIFTDIKGAPLKIGDRVKVTRMADFAATKSSLGKTGTVLFFEYSCGCGQSYPADPMIGISIGNETHEFWKEELSLISRLPQKCLNRYAFVKRQPPR